MLNEQLLLQSKLHAELVNEMFFFNDMSFSKMFDDTTGDLIRFSPNTFRRANDILAGAYTHSIAIDQLRGDDCIDYMGTSLELKLCIVSMKDFNVNENGSLVRDTGTTFQLATAARFAVGETTDIEHHAQDTAFILYSSDHNQFVTGFILSGDKVKSILNNGKVCTARKIPLNAFMEHGYEFGSEVPHMGYERYYKAAWYYVAARQGLLNEEDCLEAYRNWIDLADASKLKKL